MQSVTLDEARERLGELFAAASSGEEVLIRDGAQSVQLVPRVGASSGEPKKARRAGSLEGLLVVPPDFDEPLDDFKEYM